MFGSLVLSVELVVWRVVAAWSPRAAFRWAPILGLLIVAWPAVVLFVMGGVRHSLFVDLFLLATVLGSGFGSSTLVIYVFCLAEAYVWLVRQPERGKW